METTSATSILSTGGEDEEPQDSLDGSGDMSYENAEQDGSGDHMGYGNGDQRPFTCIYVGGLDNGDQRPFTSINVGGLDEEPNNDEGGTEYDEGGYAGDLDYGNYYGQDGNEDARDGAREIGNQETTPEGEGDRSSNVTTNDQSNTPEQKDEYLNDASDQPNIALNAELSQSEKSEDTSNNHNPSNFTNDGGIPPANAPPPQPQPQPSALSNINDGGSPPANTTANAPTSPQQPPQGVPTLSQPKPKPSSTTANAPTSPQQPQQSVHTQSYPKPKPNNTANTPASLQHAKQSVTTKSQPKAKPSSTANAPTSPQQLQQSAPTQSQSKPSSDTPSKQEKIMQPQQGQVQRELPNNEKGGGEEKAPGRSQSGGGGQDLPTLEEDSISLNRAFKGTTAHRTIITNAEEEETGGDPGATHKYADGGDGDGDNIMNEEEETGGEEAEGGDGDGDNIMNEEEETGGEEAEGGDGDGDNITDDKEEETGGEETEGGDGDGDNIINEEEEQEIPPANAPPPQPQSQPSALSNANDGGSPPANTTANAPTSPQHPPQGVPTQSQPKPKPSSTANAPTSPQQPQQNVHTQSFPKPKPKPNTTANSPTSPQQPKQSVPTKSQPKAKPSSTVNAPTSLQKPQQSAPTQSQSKPSSDTPSKQEKIMQPQQGQVQRELPNNEKAPSRNQSGGGGQDLPTPEEDSISLNRAFKGTAAHRTIITNAEEEEETGGDQGPTHKYADGGGDNITNEEEETGGEEAEGGDGDGDNITNEEEEKTRCDQIGRQESEGGDGDWDNITNEEEEQETGGDQIGCEEYEGGDGDGDNIINEEEEEEMGSDQIGGEAVEGGDGGWDNNRNEEADQNQEKTPKGKEDQDSNNTTNEQSDASKPNAELSQSEKSEDTSNNNNQSNTKDGGSSPTDNTPPQQQSPPSAPPNTTANALTSLKQPQQSVATISQPKPRPISNANAPTSPQQPKQSVLTQSQANPKPSSDTPSKQEKMQPQQGQVQIRELPNNEKVGGQEKAPSKSQSGGGQDLRTPEQDSISLYRAFKGNGCDVGKIVEILSNRDAPHIEDIKIHYLKAYGEELSVRLSSELSSLGKGDFKEKFGFDLGLSANLNLKFSNDLKALSLWILDEAERDATIVRQGMSAVSLDLEAVTEVICSRTPAQLRRLKQAYFSLYSSKLLDDITKSTFRFNGWHKELLIACLDDKKRNEGKNVDLKLAEEDAKQLYQDREKIWGTNKKTFVDIFTRSNRRHLDEVEAAYNRLYGHSLEKAVANETSGSFGDGLLILLKCAKNSAKYFAEVLHKAMEGVGTSDTKLIRVVVTRADIDMEEIKNQYDLAYKVTLKDAIHKNTSGQYRTFLLNIVGRSRGASANGL